MKFAGVIATSLLSIAAIFIITKLIGHKQISQLDFFDYICGITVGSIAAELATELEEPIYPLLALAVYGIISVLLSLAARKLPRTRKFINGTPTILMNDGKIYRKNLKKAKLDLSEFMIMCREQGYFDLNDIKCAVYEYDGRLSVLPTAASRPVCAEDLKITARQTHVGTELIMDGRILGENLERLGKSENWLELSLAARGYENVGEIFLAIYRSEDDSLQIFSGE